MQTRAGNGHVWKPRCKSSFFRMLFFLSSLAVILVGLGCSRYGLVRDHHTRDFYEVPKQLSDGGLDYNPHFIIYGDNRPGFRAKEVLTNRDTWLTWKQLYLPGIYQLYLVGTGVVGGINYLAWNPDYGHREARRVRDAIRQRAQMDKVDFIINTGDIVTDGRRVKDWKRFLRQNKEDVPLVTDFPYLPVAGNHDRTSDPVYGVANFADVFSYPLFYTVECPDIDFFIVHSNVLIDQYGYIDDSHQDDLFEQWFVANDASDAPAWLQGKLAASDKTFKIVIMHHPLIVFGKHYDNWLNTGYGNKLQSKRRRLLTLFREEGVQIVFHGHQHGYEHDTISFNDDRGGKDIIHSIITGGGGAPLHRSRNERDLARLTAEYKREGIDVACNTQRAIHNYLLVETGVEEIVIKVFEVSKSKEDKDQLVDEITVKKLAEGP